MLDVWGPKRMAHNMRLPSWLKNKNKREILSFVGGGAATLAGGIFALYAYIQKDAPKFDVTYRLCVSARQGAMCPIGYLVVENTGEDTVARWVKTECSRYKNVKTQQRQGPVGECACFLVEVKCTVS